MKQFKVFLLFLLCMSLVQNSVGADNGAAIGYQLPTSGPLPQTYRVTLAIVDAKNPDWIISQFACGVARTVTTENKGRFAETWDGLDDNFMPVPPGEYAVKGIFMPARKWAVDNEWHSITPRFAGGASTWLPSPEQTDKREPFGGDPTGQPLRDVAVGPNGVAVFYYQYLENGLGAPMIDLKKPAGYDQFVRAFPSGGAAGGTSATTDGETVWGFSTDGGPKFVYRADGKSFGKSEGANRSNAYLPTGWVTAMASARGANNKPLVFIAQRGKIIPNGNRDFQESATEFVNKVTVHDGENGTILRELAVPHPQGLAGRNQKLYVLHRQSEAASSDFAISETEINGSAWRRVFTVPQKIRPFDLEVDSQGRFYLSDEEANKVFQLDVTGKVTQTFGRLSAQKPGAYDRETLMAPGKLATWKDAQGNDRLLIIENAGPNRVSEWSPQGKLLREFLSLQTKANDGYAVDPDNPQHIYIPGHEGWLTRFNVDYQKRTWTVDAVWPNVGNDEQSPQLHKPQLIRTNGRTYLAGGRSFNVYRLAGDKWLLSAAILKKREGNKQSYALWHDANGNGRVDEAPTPMQLPGAMLRYHGENWLDDLSLVALDGSSPHIWRLVPQGFDAHGNPIFKEWKKLLTDPVFMARTAGTADAVHGGNELAQTFSSDWAQADGSLKEGFWVQARGGKSFSANEGAQYKISRYVPDGKGAYQLTWRTGRAALQGTAKPGEMYGAMRIRRPLNGLLSVIDQSRCGVLLYTTEGLYVDTIFPDGRRVANAGLYPQPGEFFSGSIFPNRDNGKIYFAMGKYTPLLFEAQGWSLKENPVRPLTTLPKSVMISAAQIALPPEIALSLRGGAGGAKIARWMPALGQPAFDGSLNGWESAEPITFSSDEKQSVEVRALYRPDALLLRWHARLAQKFAPRDLPPLSRIFTHDQKADTLSFYLQGDVNTKPNIKSGGAREGRPGDARFVFGLFKNGNEIQPVGLALYPSWPLPNAQPQVYRTPVGQAAFAHAGPVEGAKLAHKIDEDGQGFVLIAEIPRAAVPALPLLAGGLKTQVNFSATFGGHNKFWWANSDGSANRETFDEPSEAHFYPGSWAPAQWLGLDKGVTVQHWQICGPFGGPGAEKFKHDPNGKITGTDKEMKQAVREFYEAAAYPPDTGQVDLQAVYQGEMVRGYWNDPGKVKWKTASIADLDTRVILGGAQVWYGATWIYAPQAMELEFQFQSHPMTYLRWFLNGERIAVDDYKEMEGTRRVASKKLRLRAGWNQVFFRGYAIGYPPFRAGLVLQGDEAKLWQLRLSSTPQQ
ncbi:MAG TPA: hypothetical protein VGB77_08515 [Abditibacteriaceae bacterium]